MTVIGIDPGLDGGLAAIEENVLTLRVMPVVQAGKRRQIDEQALVGWLMPYAVKKTTVFIESVGARPGQGVACVPAKD